MVDGFRASVRGEDREFADEFRRLADPGRDDLDRFTDDELAAIIAREPNSKQGHLASSILRSRDNWRSPARWALLVSALSLVVAIAAFFRTVQ